MNSPAFPTVPKVATILRHASFFSKIRQQNATICKMVDKMMMTYLKGLETQFVTQGGIKERMYQARTGYRQSIDEELARLRQEVPKLQAEITRLQQLLTQHGIKF